MSDVRVKSRWIDRNNSDVVVVTDLLNDLVLFDYCNNESKKSGSRSKSDFIKQFKLLNAAPVPQADMVNHPPHYKDASGVGCTEVVKHMMYFGGACFKYLYRCGSKWNDIEDLKKAVRCAELANDDRFITDESWLRAMYQVASHRDGNIRDAMFCIRSQQWGYVIESVKAEIARLESE